MFSNTKYGLLLYLPSDSNIKSRLGEMEDRDFALDPPNVSIVSEVVYLSTLSQSLLKQ